MKEITLKIPDKKLNFFLELVKQLGFEITEQVEIPEEHKQIVRERIKNADPKEMPQWKEAREMLRFKGKS